MENQSFVDFITSKIGDVSVDQLSLWMKTDGLPVEQYRAMQYEIMRRKESDGKKTPAEPQTRHSIPGKADELKTTGTPHVNPNPPHSDPHSPAQHSPQAPAQAGKTDAPPAGKVEGSSHADSAHPETGRARIETHTSRK